MNYFIKIYGCQYNEWDGARIDYLLQQIGLIPAKEKEADIIFVLSCSVRKTAVDRAMSIVKNNPGKKIIITGCILEDDKKKYEKKNVLLWDINKPEDLIKILDLPEQFNIQQFNLESPASSYLPITIGCNNFCSYCAVPYTRGREISRPFEDVVADFKKMLKNGHKEIMLLGQNVNSYGQNYESRIMNYEKFDKTNTSVISTSAVADEKSHLIIDNTKPFAALLETLNAIPGDFTIQFTSNHPKDMTDDIIAAVRDLNKVKKEIHLPLQSGSNKILMAMNRPYTKEQYLELVKKIKKEIPEIKISTDSIIGFPGETEDDFQETVDVYRKVGFTQAFNNKYSPRVGTAAFKLGDPIPWKEKERRWRILNDITYLK